MTERHWEKFEGVAARRQLGLRVSIRQDGGVYIDAETYQELGKPQAVFLLWEEKTRTIGVQAASLDVQSAVVVRDAKQGMNLWVARSMPFMRKCGLDLTKSLRLPFAYVEDGVLILELKTAVPIGQRWKQKRDQDARRVAHKEKKDEAEKMRVDRLKAAEKLAAERSKLKAERERARAAEVEFEKRTRELARLRRRHQAVYGTSE